MPRRRRDPREAHLLKRYEAVQPCLENGQARLGDLLLDMLGDVRPRLDGRQNDPRTSRRIICDALLIRLMVLIASTMSEAEGAIGTRTRSAQPIAKIVACDAAPAVSIQQSLGRKFCIFLERYGRSLRPPFLLRRE